jgi:hypothetical protein
LPNANEVRTCLYSAAASACSLSNCRTSTGGTLSPMAGPVDPVGYSQGVRGHHLYNPHYRDNLPAIRPPISPAQISIRLDSRDRHLGHEDRLRLRHSRSLHLVRSRTLPHVQLRLQWLLDPSQRLRLTYRTRSLAPRLPIPQDRAPYPVMVTRLIQQPVHHQPLLPRHLSYPLWTNC